MWPSSYFAGRIVDRLKGRGFSHPVRHICYVGAGHSAGRPPYCPTAPLPGFHPRLRTAVTRGGDASANAAASVAGSRETLEFLEANYGLANAEAGVNRAD